MIANKTLLSVEEAYKLVQSVTKSRRAEVCALSSAYGRILADDIKATVALPPFDQSAMDGYALKFSDAASGELEICGEVSAGIASGIAVGKNQAVRIFTGAMMPDGADTVIMQEKVTVKEGKILFATEEVEKGQNVRLIGSQIKAGEIAQTKGNKLNAGGIGYLAALGVSEVNVVQNPIVKVIVTGSELQQAGAVLKPGEIYESNSTALIAALTSIGISNVSVTTVRDDESLIRTTIDKAMSSCDLLLITGGVSVGDYDFTGKALKELNVECIFHKVAQKPGKPLYFGKKNETIVFGLPGNPASVLSCFYEYVYRSVQIMRGESNADGLQKTLLRISQRVKKKSGLTNFLKGKVNGGEVSPLHGQESYILSSLAEADCFIRIPEEASEIEAGTMVECHLLPY